MRMSDETVLTKEMGITHDEFFRNIKRVVDTDEFAMSTGGIKVVEGDKVLEITISEQTERRIALFVLPVTHVTLTFSGYESAEISTLMQRFDRAFQRGGG